MINLQEEIPFILCRETAHLTGVVIALFDAATQGLSHQPSLPNDALPELNQLSEVTDKALQICDIKSNLGAHGAVAARRDILEPVDRHVVVAQIYRLKAEVSFQTLGAE